MITQVRLKELLHYDSETGVFTRLSRPRCTTIKIGESAGAIDQRGYRVIKLDNGRYRASRLAWLYVRGVWPKKWIDHKSGDRANDAFANLREATPAENARNAGTGKRNTSGVKGVHYRSTVWKWQARISVNGKRVSLGHFDSKEAAALAYREAAQRQYGEFARL